MVWPLVVVLSVSGCAGVAGTAGEAGGAAADAAPTEDAPADVVFDPHADIPAPAHWDTSPGHDAGGAAADAPTASVATLSAVTPWEGSVGGGEWVQLEGYGLSGVTQVAFGPSPALEVVPIDDYTVQARTPPGVSGWVDVSVVLTPPDEQTPPPTVSLAEAFRYIADVQVHSVEPSTGDATGGAKVTIEGSGFRDDTAFAFGDRLALAPLVLDSETAVVIAPPGQPGLVAVRAVNDDGVGELLDAFQYVAPPVLSHVDPAVMTSAGGAPLQLHGSGLTADGASVQLVGPGPTLTCEVVQVTADGSRLTFVAPPTAGETGVYTVRYANNAGTAVLPDAVLVVPPAEGGKPAIGNGLAFVTPNALPGNKLRPVVVAVHGPMVTEANGAKPEVRFGNTAATVLSWSFPPAVQAGGAGTIRVLPPPMGLGKLGLEVAVKVLLPSGSVAKQAAFTFLPDSPSITTFAPPLLDTAGGSPFTLRFGPVNPAYGAVKGVRIGALLASGLTVGGADEQGLVTLTGAAPEGSPGPADVRVVFAGGQAIDAPGLAAFGGGSPAIAALVPSRGAVAGGTLVQLLGHGLTALTGLKLGDKDVYDFEIIHDGLVRFRTTPAEPGVVALKAWFAGAAGAGGPSTDTLDKAFTFFDPVAIQSGTWGPPIDGALNVTVYSTGGGTGPVAGALVAVGQGQALPHAGYTDDNGQVVISELDLSGPLTVSASKPGYTATSVVAVNAENVTVRLRKKPPPPPPPSSGNGSGAPDDEPDPFPEGVIEGLVANADKFLQLPAGSCDGHGAIAGHCQPCATDNDCYLGTFCDVLQDPLGAFDAGNAPTSLPAQATVGQAPRYCTSACLDDSECPAGFECRANAMSQTEPGTFTYRCTPRIGEPQVRCRTSSPSLWGGNPDPGPGAIADPSGAFEIEARLGDVAVVCEAGYVRKATLTQSGGAFVPLMMGLTRQVTVSPGETTPGVLVWLDTPLSRRVRVRLDRIPLGPDALDHDRFVLGALDLGGEGYVGIGETEVAVPTDTLTLRRQPWGFPGGWGDLAYTVYGGITGPGPGGTPSSLAVKQGMPFTSVDRYAWVPPGAEQPVLSGQFTQPVQAIDSDGAAMIAVGDEGRIWAWTGTSWTQQPSPTTRDLRAVWLLGDGDGWAGGEDGVLLRRDPTLGWRREPSPTSKPLIAISGRGKTDVWMLDADNGLYHYHGVWEAVAGPWSSPPQNLPPWMADDTPRLRSLWVSPEGPLILVGDAGGIVRGDVAPNGEVFGWQALESYTDLAIHAVRGLGIGAFWVAGERGYVARIDATSTLSPAVSVLATPTEQPLYAIAPTSSGVQIVGGQGAWLQVGLDNVATDRSVADLPVDLRGVGEALGHMAAAGEPVLVMGPYLEMPYVTSPNPGDVGLGPVLSWATAGGLEPTLQMIRVSNAAWQTEWELFVAGDVSSVLLPDFTVVGGASALPYGDLRVRIWRIYAPGIDVDEFGYNELSMWRWVSYSYTLLMLDGSSPLGPGLSPGSLPAGGPPPGLPPLPPSPIPK